MTLLKVKKPRKMPKRICARGMPLAVGDYFKDTPLGGMRYICTKAKHHKNGCGCWEYVSQSDHSEAEQTGKLPDHDPEDTTLSQVVSRMVRNIDHLVKQTHGETVKVLPEIKDEVFALVLNNEVIKPRGYKPARKLYTKLGSARGAKTHLSDQIRDQVKIVRFRAVEIVN